MGSGLTGVGTGWVKMFSHGRPLESSISDFIVYLIIYSIIQCVYIYIHNYTYIVIMIYIYIYVTHTVSEDSATSNDASLQFWSNVLTIDLYSLFLCHLMQLPLPRWLTALAA